MQEKSLKIKYSSMFEKTIYQIRNRRKFLNLRKVCFKKIYKKIIINFLLNFRSIVTKVKIQKACHYPYTIDIILIDLFNVIR